MGRKTTQSKAVRKRYSQDYRNEALALAERIGVVDAAKERGLHESQIYGWRAKARLRQDRGERESHQAAEIVRLKRQLAEREQELAIVKKGQRTSPRA